MISFLSWLHMQTPYFLTRSHSAVLRVTTWICPYEAQIQPVTIWNGDVTVLFKLVQGEK